MINSANGAVSFEKRNVPTINKSDSSYACTVVDDCRAVLQTVITHDFQSLLCRRHLPPATLSPAIQRILDNNWQIKLALRRAYVCLLQSKHRKGLICTCYQSQISKYPAFIAFVFLKLHVYCTVDLNKNMFSQFASMKLIIVCNFFFFLYAECERICPIEHDCSTLSNVR